MAKFQPLVMETMTKSKDGFLGVGVLQATNSGINTSGGLGTAPGICWEEDMVLLNPMGFAVTGNSLSISGFRRTQQHHAPVRTAFLGAGIRAALLQLSAEAVVLRVPLSSVTHIPEG